MRSNPAAIIRPAAPDDAPAIAEVRMLSWRTTYRGTVPDSYLDAMQPDDAVDRWRAVAAGEAAGTELLVCVENNAVVGFACYGAAREPCFGYGGELHATYYRPDAMGRGLGSRMMKQVRRNLVRLGHDDMIVWVMEANARGRHFYERIVGAELIDGSRNGFEIDGARIFEVAYGIRPLSQQGPSR